MLINLNYLIAPIIGEWNWGQLSISAFAWIQFSFIVWVLRAAHGEIWQPSGCANWTEYDNNKQLARQPPVSSATGWHCCVLCWSEPRMELYSATVVARPLLYPYTDISVTLLTFITTVGDNECDKNKLRLLWATGVKGRSQAGLVQHIFFTSALSIGHLSTKTTTPLADKPLHGCSDTTAVQCCMSNIRERMIHHLTTESGYSWELQRQCYCVGMTVLSCACPCVFLPQTLSS